EVEGYLELFDPSQQVPLLTGLEELDGSQPGTGSVVHDRDGRGPFAALDLVQTLLDPGERPQDQERGGARAPAPRMPQITAAVKQAVERLSITEILVAIRLPLPRALHGPGRARQQILLLRHDEVVDPNRDEGLSRRIAPLLIHDRLEPRGLRRFHERLEVDGVLAGEPVVG